PELAEFLTNRDYTDAMVVPLRSESTVGALIVSNRLSDVATFSDDDLHVCETIANHASVLLENSRLVQRLRAEVSDKEYQATHDVLTGLANRTLFRNRVAQAIASRQPGAVCAVMLLDLDRFKEVNDTLGHHIGDSLLQQVGQRLVEVMPHADVISRLGGDEFAILVTAPDVTSAMRDAQTTRDALEQPFQLPDLELYVGASVGVALAPSHGDSPQVLLQRADVAMYAAKTEHTGCELYAPERDSHSHERLALVGELRSALAAGSLTVHYQPKVALADRKVVGFEALVRWHHPERGFIPPDDFIPIAERTGLIRPLTEYVLGEALAQCREWRAVNPDAHVAVNLSAAVVLNMDLARDLRRLLDAAHLPSSALTLEITESTIMSDPDRAIAVLETLASMGVRLSIDDFGTGYSSLSHLKRLPVTELKIDKSFVMNMEVDENDAVIVQSLIELGRNLGLHVVAEGVESQQIWNDLVTMGCDYAQGFFSSRPMSADQLVRWLNVMSQPAVN
ncbi:MAG TPA: EAL domain-containing protein, partial [Vicinamibacterales bacterium]|nr:EAL domain-containing protein [Vicinamibacterales bacterium]